MEYLLRIEKAKSAAFSGFISIRAILQPCDANPQAKYSPSNPDAPVMTATLPVKSNRLVKFFIESFHSREGSP